DLRPVHPPSRRGNTVTRRRLAAGPGWISAQVRLATMRHTTITCKTGWKRNRLPTFLAERDIPIFALLHGGESDTGLPIRTRPASGWGADAQMDSTRAFAREVVGVEIIVPDWASRSDRVDRSFVPPHRSFRFFVDRPTLGGGIASLDVAGLVGEEEG